MAAMQVQTFTGYVEHIFPPTQYDCEIAVRNYQDESSIEAMKKAKDYPRTLKFSASIKSGCSKQLENVRVGDKVVVEFYLFGSSGTSKSSGKYYCINKLNIAKTNGITILERHSPDPEVQEGEESEPVVDDIPF